MLNGEIMNDIPSSVSTENEKQKIALEWLQEKWPDENRVCEICNSKNWQIAQDLITSGKFEDGKTNFNGPIYPQIMVICTTCGNTKYFNAVIAGVVKQNDIESGAQNAE